MACFWLTNASPNAVINVALDWKTGVAAKDWASIAKKDKLDVLSYSSILDVLFAFKRKYLFDSLEVNLLR